MPLPPTGGFNTCSSCEEQLAAGRVTSDISESFNTCSSCEEQLPEIPESLTTSEFQYMLLLRGATTVCVKSDGHIAVSIHAPLARSNGIGYQYAKPIKVSIHAPLARSNRAEVHGRSRQAVSIHAPLARSNCSPPSNQKPPSPFQYMLLLRGATAHALVALGVIGVSIHAPLARSNFAMMTGIA